MKKKIAVFATGWSEQIIHDYMRGICSGFSSIGADTYLFLCYPTLGDTSEYINGEINIFKLPNMKDFDGAFVLGNSIDFPEAMEDINERCAQAGVPVIYTGKKYDAHAFVGADNYVGARQLGEHLITVHGAKDILVIGGSPDNQDSCERVRAVGDAMSEHGLELAKDYIFFSNWDMSCVKDLLDDWADKGKKWPDAIVCANDKLAMLVCKELLVHGVKVPENVLVTGFDYEFHAQIYDPSISSVDQNFYRIGEASAEQMIKLLNGKDIEREIMIPCEFVPSESCGCTESRDFDRIRREVGKNSFLDSVYFSAFQRKLSVIERSIMKGQFYSDIKGNLKRVHANYNNFEGDSFHIVLDPLFEETIYNPNIHLREKGYSSKMDVIFSMDKGEYRSVDDFDTSQIIPFIQDETQNHLFICLPLQENGRSMGYIVFCDDFEKLRKTQDMQVYVERFSVILSKFHQSISVDVLNQKLLALSETDALTHVKNRTAYEARINNIEKQLTGNPDMRFAVAIFDVNNLKKINDHFGHEIGDKYIINSCNLICRIFKHSAVYRIGGDEFAVILTDDSYIRRLSLLSEIELDMQKCVDSQLPIWERVSIAYGIADYNPEIDANVTSVVKRADSEMYICKIAMKS